MVLEPLRRPFRSRLTIAKGDPNVLALAVKRANQEMREQILPGFGVRIRANSWNPLRDDINGPSAYGMKLWLNDRLAREILKSDKLMKETEGIVIRAVLTAVDEKPKAFVQSLLDQVKDEYGDQDHG